MWVGFFYFLEPEHTACPVHQPSIVVKPPSNVTSFQR